MRLVLPPRGANAGLKRYKGEGIYRSIGRKNTSLRKITKEEADAIALRKKSAGKGIDDSTNTRDNDDFVDFSSSDESVKVDEDSAMESISNSAEEEPVNDDKESNIDDKEEVDNKNEENAVNDLNLKRKFDEEGQEAGVKHKYTPSLVDFIINKPTKLQRFDSSMSDLQENDIHSITNSNDPDSHKDERFSEQSTNHQLTLIRPTEGKKWPQKKCVYCRRKYGLRNDTRFICMQCNVALCKEPCFADYHYHATSLGMSPKAAT